MNFNNDGQGLLDDDEQMDNVDRRFGQGIQIDNGDLTNNGYSNANIGISRNDGRADISCERLKPLTADLAENNSDGSTSDPEDRVGLNHNKLDSMHENPSIDEIDSSDSNIETLNKNLIDFKTNQNQDHNLSITNSENSFNSHDRTNPSNMINSNAIDANLGSLYHSSYKSEITIKVYSRRWYILLVFSILGFAQGGLIDVYQVTAQSAEAAFGWNDATVSLMQNWIYLTYVIGVIPFSWLIDVNGLRISVIICAFLTFLGTGFRCLSTSQPHVTWFANIANVFVGLGGPVAFTAGPVISGLWFPPKQRTTATAIGTIAGFIGPCATFIIGPYFVDVPKLGNETEHECRNESLCTNYTVTQYINIDIIKHQILYLRYGECCLCALILILCIIYFPSKPPHPPSISASQEKVGFFNGIKSLFRRENRNFWLVCITYMLTTGLYDVWNSLLDVNLKSLGVAEDEVGLVGALAIFTGSVVAIILGRAVDLMSGYMKVLSVILVGTCALSTYWFLLVSQFIRPFSNVQLYAAAILQGICINSPIPLFYEMAIESNYPVNETVTSGVMSLMFNIFPLIFLVIFWIPNIGTDWMNWFMYLCVLVAFPLILLFKERSRRTDVDKGETEPEEGKRDNITI